MNRLAFIFGMAGAAVAALALGMALANHTMTTSFICNCKTGQVFGNDKATCGCVIENLVPGTGETGTNR